MGELIKYEAACRAIAEAKAVDEVKDIRDRAMAMKLYARAKNRHLECDAFEIRLRAERRVGEMMTKQPKAQGAREAGTNRGSTRDIEKPASYAEVGIDKNPANRARKLHALPQGEFERVVSEGREAIERGVERQVLRAVEIAAARQTYDARKQQGAKVDLHALVKSGKRFPVILADPPWLFRVWGPGDKAHGTAQAHYTCLGLDDIKALPHRD